MNLVPSPASLHSEITLRPYQKEALNTWNKQKRGIVIMPTGSGKTILGLKIAEQINSATLIIVPTLDLVSQWKSEIKEAFDIKVGEFTGNSKDLKGITVTTYDSAYLNAEHMGNKFKLVIFDEIHHLASEGYRHIAEIFAIPFRLGLTATYEREDGLHTVLPEIVGDVIYRAEIDDLAGKYLAEYRVEKISIEFTPGEKKAYEKNRKIFRNYLISRNIRMNSASDFQKIVMRSGRDPAARAAILAHKKAEKIAFNSKNKLAFLRKILKRRPEDRIIIFTKYNSMVYEISRTFFIPCITHKTGAGEREKILKQFRKGEYTAIVSSRVLDEGIDVPEVNIGIIVSGTGSSREYVQRLGRLLRPKPDKQAILYELITKESIYIITIKCSKRIF
ncbi:MAG: DEAD/DEAH box helicase [Promethearchaeia archaeon]